METESIKIVTDGVVEICKILGPAIITALVGYKAGKSHIEVKLKELERVHAFSASEKLFDYYRDREKELSDAHTSIYENLSYLVGYSSATEGVEELRGDTLKLYDMYENSFPTQLRLTIRDLEKHGFKGTEEYKQLEKLRDEPKKPNNEETFGDRVFGLMQKYEDLRIANQLILEKLSTGYIEEYTKHNKGN